MAFDSSKDLLLMYYYYKCSREGLWWLLDETCVRGDS